jgi:hypothetical protein
VLLAFTLAACGKKGPPVAPELRLPASATGLAAFVDQGSILLTWTNPRVRLDGTPLRDLTELKLHRREDTDGGPLKPAMLSGGRVVGYDEVAAIALARPAPGTVEGGAVRWLDDRGLTLGHRYVYVVTALDSVGRSSPPSERVAITFLAAPKPPADVKATPGSHQVTLEWSASAEFTDGSPASGDVRYVILRGTGSAGPLAMITPQPLAATSYVDTGLENDTDYRYAVRGVRVDPRGTAGGAPSEVVSVAPVETARPRPPANLVGVPSPGAVRLAWSPSPSPAVALYAVYRATGSGAFTRIASTLPANTTFVDREVRAGATYRYVVTALDSARVPNESARSNEVSVTLP